MRISDMTRGRLTTIVLLTSFALISVAASATEIPLGPPVFAPSTAVQFRPNSTVALGSSTILAAWEERSMAAWPNTAETVIRTFSHDGQPLQPTFLSLGGYYAPRVVWNGSDYFVVLSDYISRFGSIAPIPAIDAVRVRENGTVVEGSHVTIAKNTSTINTVGVAWNGNEYLVGATDRLIVVAADGSPVATTPHPEAPVVAVAPFADGFYILSAGMAGVAAERVSAAGAIVESRPLSNDRTSYTGAIAQNGSAVAAVWPSADAVWAAVITGSSTAAPFQIAPLGGAQLDSLAWDGGAWVTTWQKGDSLCRGRFDGRSVPVNVCDRISPGLFQQPLITSDGSKTALVWIEGLFSGSDKTDVVKLALDSAGHLPEPQRGQTISVAAEPMSQPAVAPDGRGGLIAAWSLWNALERRTEVHLGGLTADGSVRPDQMISMAGSSPRIAFGHSTAWMVWTDGRLSSPFIEGGRIDPSASSRLGVDSEASFDEGAAPHVASDGKEFLFVWQSPQAADGTSQIMTKVIAESMALPRPPSAPIDSIVTHRFSPSVDWSGRGFLVTWLERYPDPPVARVVAQLVDGSGKPVGARLVVAENENFNPYGDSPTTTTCGSTCLVTWMRIDGTYMGATVSPDATIASQPFAITHVSLPYQSEPAVTATGSTFSVYLPSYGPAQQFIVDSGDNVLVRRVVASDSRGGIAAAMIGTTPWIVYARATTPDELLGGATQLFASPVPPLRRRSAAP